MDNFAAYVKIPESCNAKEILTEIRSHVAEIVFLDLSQYQDVRSFKQDNYDIPVFVIEDSSNSNFFMFEDDQSNKKFIQIFYSKKGDDKKNFVTLDFFYICSAERSKLFLS